jgi:putative DNA primase/helicase
MNALALAKALGGDIVGPGRIIAPGPGHSPADRSMSILIDPAAPDGFVVSSFAGDDWRECRGHVRQRLGLDHTAYRVPAPVAHSEPASRAAMASALWKECVSIRCTLAETYLVHRGLNLPSEALSGRALRFHPFCPFRLQTGGVVRLPAMIAAMVDIRSNEFRGVHRTALAAGGLGKADVVGLGNPKKMLGPAAGACIKLSPDEEIAAGLHIAEGIETALACLAKGFRPTWVALSAGGISAFPIIPGIEAFTIFADHDPAGTRAATICGERWSRAGREVTITTPAMPGTDFADGRAT